MFLITQNNTGISGSCSSFSSRQRRRAASLKVVASGSNSRSADRNVSVLMESTLTETREASSVVEVDQKCTVGGGVQDVYGEDSATEDQLLTPWSLSVAR